MPIYEYSCKNHHHFERVLPVADYKSKQTCMECGEEGRRIISLPMVRVSQDICYDSPIDGRPITSMAKRREDLARSGCQPYDPEMKKDTDRLRKQEAESLERKFDETVEEAYAKMPTKKKEALASDLLHGADATLTRGTPNLKPITREIKHAPD